MKTITFTEQEFKHLRNIFNRDTFHKHSTVWIDIIEYWGQFDKRDFDVRMKEAFGTNNDDKLYNIEKSIWDKIKTTENNTEEIIG